MKRCPWSLNRVATAQTLKREPLVPVLWSPQTTMLPLKTTIFSFSGSFTRSYRNSLNVSEGQGGVWLPFYPPPPCKDPDKHCLENNDTSNIVFTKQKQKQNAAFGFLWKRESSAQLFCPILPWLVTSKRSLAASCIFSLLIIVSTDARVTPGGWNELLVKNIIAMHLLVLGTFQTQFEHFLKLNWFSFSNENQAYRFELDHAQFWTGMPSEILVLEQHSGFLPILSLSINCSLMSWTPVLWFWELCLFATFTSHFSSIWWHTWNVFSVRFSIKALNSLRPT